jgi:hypothetical protein
MNIRLIKCITTNNSSCTMLILSITLFCRLNNLTIRSCKTLSKLFWISSICTNTLHVAFSPTSYKTLHWTFSFMFSYTIHWFLPFSCAYHIYICALFCCLLLVTLLYVCGFCCWINRTHVHTNIRNPHPHPQDSFHRLKAVV